MYRADRRLYLTADKSRVVEESSSEAAFLLVGAGGNIPLELAQRYGLVDSPTADPVEVKATGPAEDKMIRPPENKGGRRKGKQGRP